MADPLADRPPPEGFEAYPAISSFMALLAPLFARLRQDGGIDIGLWVQAHHLNHQGAVHSGVVASLADNAMGYHAARVSEGPVATVNLAVDYFLRVHQGEWLEVHSRLERRGGRLAFGACTS